MTPWTAAYQAPPSMGFSRQEYWSRVPLPSPTASTVGKKDLKWGESIMKKQKTNNYNTDKYATSPTGREIDDR